MTENFYRKTSYPYVHTEYNVTTHVTTVSNGAVDATEEVRSRSSVSRKRPKGWKAPTSFSSSGRAGATLAFPNAFSTSNGAGRIQTQTGSDTDNTNPAALPSFDESVATRAVIQARLRLKGQNVNYAQAFAERKQVVDLVSDTATTIAKGVFALRKGRIPDGWNLGKLSKQLLENIRRAQSGPKGLANAWLSLQYGWKPLLSDVYGAAQDLANKDTGDPQRYTYSVRGSSSTGLTVRTDASDQANQTLGACACYKHDFSTLATGAFVRLDAYLVNRGLASLAQGGFTNPQALAWELLPFSFVVDWFAPVGNYLSQMDAETGWSFRGGSISRRMKKKGIRWATTRHISGKSSESASGARVAHAWSLQREVYSAFPYPATISPKNPLSSGHLANALALLAQAFGR